MKKVLIIITVIVAAAIVAAAIGAGVIYSRYNDDPAFIKGTTLNGEPIEGKTPDEAADEAAVRFNTENIRVQIREDGEISIKGSLKDFGYVYDDASFREFLKESHEEQRRDLFTLIGTFMRGFSMTAGESYLYDSTAVEKMVTSDHLAKERFKTVDNTLVYDRKSNRYHVEKGYIGNEIDDKALQEYTAQILADAVEGETIPELISIDIPADVYISKEPAGDLEELQKECDQKNFELEKQEILESFADVSVTYVFGDWIEQLTFDDFKDWIRFDDHLNVSFDEERIAEYVAGLAEQYDTLYLDRAFTTTSGGTVVIPAGLNEYGYSIDYDAECALLYENLASKSETAREPVYIDVNDYGIPYYYGRNGEDDLNGTYVEVDLTQQHLWYYVNGSLLTESDIVSGSVAKNAETQVGCFPLAQKKSPETLTGEDADGSNSYSVTVKYWMPFFNGQGLHDATFRNEFGGEIYKKNGSHGCINLPFEAAETIYQNIEVGVPIIIYES